MRKRGSREGLRTFREAYIRRSGLGDLRPALIGALVLLGFLLAGCGGGEEEPQTVPEPAGGGTVGVTAGGETTVGAGQAEVAPGRPFSLNTGQPVPPDFRAAYQRRALIAVQFYKMGDDPLYPQGLEVDEQVRQSMEELRPEYPTIEFFSYDIDNPGQAETSEELSQGEYGTLAAQLGVGYTPFVATLAPRGDRYIVENLFQGYVPQPVLDQALFDLTAADVQGNTSDVDVTSNVSTSHRAVAASSTSPWQTAA